MEGTSEWEPVYYTSPNRDVSDSLQQAPLLVLGHIALL